MPWTDRILALALIAGVVPLWRMAEGFPGAAETFPRVVLAAIIFLAALMGAWTFLPARGGRSGGEGRRGARATARPLTVFAVSVAAALVMPLLGFFPVALALIAALFPLLGAQSLRVYGTVTALLLAFIYIVFALLLGVPLGAGQMFGG